MVSERQLPHKIVNLLFTISLLYNKLTILWWIWLSKTIWSIHFVKRESHPSKVNFPKSSLDLESQPPLHCFALKPRLHRRRRFQGPLERVPMMYFQEKFARYRAEEPSSGSNVVPRRTHPGLAGLHRNSFLLKVIRPKQIFPSHHRTSKVNPRCNFLPSNHDGLSLPWKWDGSHMKKE